MQLTPDQQRQLVDEVRRQRVTLKAAEDRITALEQTSASHQSPSLWGRLLWIVSGLLAGLVVVMAFIVSRQNQALSTAQQSTVVVTATYAAAETSAASAQVAGKTVEAIETRNATALTLTAVKAPTSAVAGKWQLSVDRSSFDDSKTVVLRLEAEREIIGWARRERPTLILRCKEAAVDLYIVVGMSAAVELGKPDQATIRIRLGKDAPQMLLTDESTSGDALFFPDSKSWIDRLSRYDEMVFGFTPFNAAPVETTFDLRGLTEAIKPLKEACKW